MNEVLGSQRAAKQDLDPEQQNRVPSPEALKQEWRARPLRCLLCPPRALYLSTHIHIHAASGSYSYLLLVTALGEEGERGQDPEVVSHRSAGMSGRKLKAQEARQSRAWPSAALCVSLAVSPNIRSNHPQLWSQRAEAVSWNKNRTHIHKYTDVFWKLREAMISLRWPDTVGFKRIWIASEDTASYSEPIKTASHSFWQEIVSRLDAEGLGCPKHGAGQPCHCSGLETEVCIHVWQSSLIPMLLSPSVSGELVHPGKKLHPKTRKVKRLVFLTEIQRHLYYQRHLIHPGAIFFL